MYGIRSENISTELNANEMSYNKYKVMLQNEINEIMLGMITSFALYDISNKMSY